MLTLVLVGGLLLSTAAAAPNLCAGSCDDSQTGASSNGLESLHSSGSYSQNKRVPRADSQILSEAESNKEVQRLKQLIDNFMDRYDLNSSSLVDDDLVNEYQNQAMGLKVQLDSLWNQVSEGSSHRQEMLRMLEDFLFRFTLKMNEMTIMNQKPGSRAGGSSSHNQSSEQHQQRLKMCQEQIVDFYREFKKASTSEQYSQLDLKATRILEKLAELYREAGQDEQQRARVGTLRMRFNWIVSELRRPRQVAKRSATQQREEE